MQIRLNESFRLTFFILHQVHVYNIRDGLPRALFVQMQFL